MASGHAANRDSEGVFRLSTRRDGPSLEIQVEGRLDGCTGHHLVDMVHQLTSAGDTVTVDLTMVADMDSAGARAVSRAASVIASKRSVATLEIDDPRFESLLEPHGLSSRDRRAPSVPKTPANGRRRPP